MKDLKNRLGVVMLTEPKNPVATDEKSSLLDLRRFNAAMVMAIVGTLTGVDGSNYLTPKLQESDTTADGDFTDVAAGDMDGAFTKIDATNEDSVTQIVGYKGSKRYLRVLFDFTGTGITASYVAAIGILGRPIVLPAVAPAAVAAT